MKRLSSLSVVFPALNDELSIGSLVEKTLRLLPQIAPKYEIIVIDDGSGDKTYAVLKSLQKKIFCLRLITHKKNLGYGATLVDGFKTARNDFIFYTDGDGQYDVLELKELVENLDGNTDMVTGFKVNRADPLIRRSIGYLYNKFVKIVFGLKVKDVDCDFRLFRRRLLKGITFKTTSGAFDAEFILKLQKKGTRFKEVPVHHYPRPYGQSQFFKPRRVIESLWELLRIWLQRN